ncbi:hypothetical protein KCV87_31700 [Actinosynnema pretiosum subsp. pretiosum]|uniref:Uncharacterized protein n=2 Tax=Actinosynnema TaxID=40566 RepID=C6WP69_ACTMD|nr:hypothetical protein [Actinosynnema mirum]ACU38571.1 hypothetical protein Amir_4742 [Actinosynnema mirum DSM 43827]QUF03878.1 hypothetical protein KCV87_31700 [Actinosynnema pretiosum subsp. pretiosum]
MRALRIELRRSVAPWAGLLVLLLPLPLLLLLSGPWTHDPARWESSTTTAALWLRWCLMFVWPVALGAGAVQGMRDRRSGMTELLGTTPRPVGQRTGALAAALAVCLVVGFGALAVVGVGNVLLGGGHTSAAFLPVLVVGALAVVAGGVLGLAVGRVAPHPLVAPAAAVLALVLLTLANIGLAGAQVSSFTTRLAHLTAVIGDPRGTMVTTTWSFDLVQAAWFVGLAATGVLLLAAKSSRAKVIALAPALLAAAVAVPLLPARPADAFTADAAAELVCDGPVCVSRMHADRLPVLAEAGREALRLLARLPDAPTRVVEDTSPQWVDQLPERSADVVRINYQMDSGLLEADVARTRDELLAGVGVPRCHAANAGGTDEPIIAALTVAHLTGADRPPADYPGHFTGMESMVESAWGRFSSHPEDVREQRVVATRKALLACDGTALDVLLPEGVR